ncbi:MAG: hypothetical protein AAF206_12755 [Bacteroidota bacterium]
MAKKFLDRLGDAFGEDVLADLIPIRESKGKKNASPQSHEKTPVRNNRKKRFLDSIDEKISPKTPARKENSSKPVRKSFLDTIEDALDSNAFDDIIPQDVNWRKKTPKDQMAVPKIESRFSTMITTEVLERAREIARRKGIRIKDVINVALQRYIEQIY